MPSVELNKPVPDFEAPATGDQTVRLDDLKGQNVVIIEDLISTGKSSLVAVEALKAVGANVKGMVAIFTYGFDISKENFKDNNVTLFTLSNYDSLLEQALDTNFINQNEAAILSQWNTNPAEWTGK